MLIQCFLLNISIYINEPITSFFFVNLLNKKFYYMKPKQINWLKLSMDDIKILHKLILIRTNQKEIQLIGKDDETLHTTQKK